MSLTDFDGRTLVVSKAGNDALAVSQFAGDLDGSRKYSAHCHFLTVQAAIDFAQAGDNINVHAGDYTNETLLTLKDRVSITTDANVIFPGMFASSVNTEIFGNPDVLGDIGLEVEGQSDMRIEFGIMTVENIGIKIGNAVGDQISISGYTGDIVSQGRGVWVNYGTNNVDLEHDDIYAVLTGYRVGAQTGDASNRVSLDVEARDVIVETLAILHTGLNFTDSRYRLRDVISTSLGGDLPTDRYAVWLNSVNGDIFTDDDRSRVTMHMRDTIAQGDGIYSALRINNGVSDTDTPGSDIFVYGDRVVNNADLDTANASTDGAVVYSKGSTPVGKSTATIDVKEILGRASKAVIYTEATNSTGRVGHLRMVNSNITNDNTDIAPVRSQVQAGSLAHITFEGCSIYTPDALHMSARDASLVRAYHKTQTLVNKPDQNGINLVTDWDGNGGNANQVDSLRTTGGAALVSETPYTRIPDADLLAVVNI